MITLEKLLTELKAESLNEIVAGTYKCGGGRRSSRSGGSSKSSKSSKSTKKYNNCYTPPKPPTGNCGQVKGCK